VQASLISKILWRVLRLIATFLSEDQNLSWSLDYQKGAMMAKEKFVSNEQEGMTRRCALRTAGLVLSAASLATAAEVCRLGADPEHPPKTLGGRDQDSSNVFQDSCYYEQAPKATVYDAGIAYPMFAFWLMLTTENWDDCLANPDWRKRLADELGSRNPGVNYQAFIENLYHKVYPDGQLSSAFHDVRQTWQGFLEDPGDGSASTGFPYGADPCPGGATILQIARLNPTGKGA
jgi:hypothetical protein